LLWHLVLLPNDIIENITDELPLLFLHNLSSSPTLRNVVADSDLDRELINLAFTITLSPTNSLSFFLLVPDLDLDFDFYSTKQCVLISGQQYIALHDLPCTFLYVTLPTLL
jgi:hypothetical protein